MISTAELAHARSIELSNWKKKNLKCSQYIINEFVCVFFFGSPPRHNYDPLPFDG